MNDIPYKREHLEWRPIKDFEDQYEVSNYGDFHILPYEFIDKANRKMKRKEKYIWSEELSEYGHGYLGIHLGGTKKTYAHILAAKAFIPNINNKTEVNHIDGNKRNNYVGCKENNYQDSNLEWVNRKENVEHASQNGLINKDSIKRKNQCKINRTKVDYKKMKKPILQIDPITNKVIKEFDSISEASRELNIPVQNICNVAKNKKYRNTTHGFKWQYKQVD